MCRAILNSVVGRRRIIPQNACYRITATGLDLPHYCHWIYRTINIFVGRGALPGSTSPYWNAPMSLINLQALREAQLHTDPFDFMVAPGMR